MDDEEEHMLDAPKLDDDLSDKDWFNIVVCGNFVSMQGCVPLWNISNFSL
jgi:hypothetical protein